MAEADQFERKPGLIPEAGPGTRSRVIKVSPSQGLAGQGYR